MYHVLSEKERTSQFLIGKVEQEAGLSPKGDMYHVLSDKGRTDVVNEILKEAGLSPKGEFYMWVLKSQFLIGKV